MHIEPQSQERPVATETASVLSIAVHVAAYAGVAVQGLAIVSVLVGVAVLSADLLGDSEGGQIAAVVLGIALLAGAVVAIRLGAGTPSEPAPPAPASILPAPPTS